MATSAHGNNLVRCPYDPSHIVLKCRLQIHFAKCEMGKFKSGMKTCNFNAQHVLPEKELDEHMAECPDRLSLDKRLTGDFNKSHFLKNSEPELASFNSPLFKSDESWDNEIDPNGSAGYIPKRPECSNGLIQDLGLMKRSERRKLFKQVAYNQSSSAPPVKADVPSGYPNLSYKTTVVNKRDDGIKHGQSVCSPVSGKQQPKFPPVMGIKPGNVIQYNYKSFYDENFPPLGN